MSKKREDIDVEVIIAMIIDGKSYRQISEAINVPLSTLHDFTSRPEHSARVKEALRYSASTFDDKAEEVLLKAKSTMTEIQRARELAQHYRWKSAKRSPKDYGDKVEQTISGELNINQTVSKTTYSIRPKGASNEPTKKTKKD